MTLTTDVKLQELVTAMAYRIPGGSSPCVSLTR